MENNRPSKTEQYALYALQNLQTATEFESLIKTHSVTPKAVGELFQVLVRLEKMINSTELPEATIAMSKQIRGAILMAIARALNNLPNQ